MRMPPYIEAARGDVWAPSSSDSAACACRPTLKRLRRALIVEAEMIFGGMRMPPYIEASMRVSLGRRLAEFGGMRMPPYIEAMVLMPCLVRARRFGGMRMPPYIEAISFRAL